MTSSSHWSVEGRVAAAAELHQPWPGPDRAAERRIAICHVTGPQTVVLGSTQGRTVVVDQNWSDRCIVRRRGGGGAVFVAPARQVWVDIWLPRADPLWDDDVVAGADWVGDAWADAMTELGLRDVAVHRGPSRGDQAAAAVCFAGLGPGEIVVGTPARKLMGLTQHRSRFGVRFQTMAVVWWDPEPVVSALWRLGLVDQAQRNALRAATVDRAVGLAQLALADPATGLPLDLGDPATGLHTVEATVVRRLAAC